jgi:hypothetical protein
MKKKQTLTFVAFCGVFLLLITIAGSFVPVQVSSEEAITRLLRENYGDSKTAWLDTIESIQTGGTTVVVTTSKSRHNDAIEICEAVSKFIFTPVNGKITFANIEVRTSEKVLVRRNGQNGYCE